MGQHRSPTKALAKAKDDMPYLERLESDVYDLMKAIAYLEKEKLVTWISVDDEPGKGYLALAFSSVWEWRDGKPSLKKNDRN